MLRKAHKVAGHAMMCSRESAWGVPHMGQKGKLNFVVDSASGTIRANETIRNKQTSHHIQTVQTKARRNHVMGEAKREQLMVIATDGQHPTDGGVSLWVGAVNHKLQ